MASLGCVAGEIGDVTQNEAEERARRAREAEEAARAEWPSFSCLPDTDPSETSLVRLTYRQYVNTLEDVATRFFSPTVTQALMEELAPVFRNVPSTEPGALDRLDQDVTQTHVDGYYEVAESFAARATATSARQTALFGACATDTDPTNDATCIDELITRLGLLTSRRPLSEAEKKFLRDDVYGASLTTWDVDAARDVITVLLMAPGFIYRMENQGSFAAGRTDLLLLDGYELAARLSYHFWQTMPDDALFAAAADGRLATEAGYLAELERVFSDPRTRDTIDELFAAWLDLEHVPDLATAAANPAFAAMAGDFQPSPALRGALIDEIRDLVRHYTWERDGSLDDLFLSDVSFARSLELASLYGVPPWSGAHDEASLVHFNANERAGLLTRAALLVNDAATNNPIHKGVFLRRRLMCDPIPAPPDDIPPPPEFEPTMTTRERVEELTMREGTSCATCHATINPAGFATEGYDPLGRVRTEERIFDDAGNLVVTRPIDARAVPQLHFGDETVVEGGVALSTLVAESGKVHACLARQYFRFTYGRRESLSRDGCALEALRTRLIQAGSLRGFLRSVALAPEFKQRKL